MKVKKIFSTILCITITIFCYRSIMYAYLFYNPITDDAVVECYRGVVDDEVYLNQLTKAILECDGYTAKNFESFSIIRCLRYAIFIDEFFPRLDLVEVKENNNAYCLYGYQAHTYKTVALDKNLKIQDVSYIIKTAH